MRRGVPDDVSDATLARFEELGLVDDAEFARQWARTRQAGRGLARRALAYELRQRGVAEEVVSATLDDSELADELESARALVRRRLGARGRPDGVDRDSGAAFAGSGALGVGLDDRERRARRLLAMLARKGYPQGVSARAVREVLAETTGDAFDTEVQTDADDDGTGC